MYQRGVERLQTSVHLPYNLPLYFNLPLYLNFDRTKKFTDKLIKYEAKSGLTTEIILDFERVGFTL